MTHTASGKRPLWGLRDRPGRLALAVFRLPVRVFQPHPERMPSDFLSFVHTGRKTGQPHQAVAMVLDDDPNSGEVVICAAWGPDTDWVRNLRARPAASVQHRRESFTPEQRFLDGPEAFDVTVRFRRAHPVRLRLFSGLLGWGDLRDDDAVRGFVHTHPFVAFRRPDESRTG